MTAEQTRKAALAANEKARARKWAYHRSDLAKTGWAPGMLQDDNRYLSRWFASKPDAKKNVRDACAAIAKATGDTQ